jgi:hypothetical protein
VVGLLQVIGMKQVVLDDPGILVGHVLELVGAADVPECPDPFDAGSLELVDDDQSRIVGLDAGAC